jgi:CIC family chloride channel protein
MTDDPEQARFSEPDGGLLALALLALVVGALAGFSGALFRLSLQRADDLRNALVVWAHGRAALGFALTHVVAATASLRPRRA